MIIIKTEEQIEEIFEKEALDNMRSGIDDLIKESFKDSESKVTGILGCCR